MEGQYEKRLSKGCSSLLEEINPLFDDHLFPFLEKEEDAQQTKTWTHLHSCSGHTTLIQPKHTPTPPPNSAVMLLWLIIFPAQGQAGRGLKQPGLVEGRCSRASKDPVSNREGLAAFTPVAQLVANRSCKHVYVTTIYILVRYLMIPDHKQSVAALFNDKTHIQ